MRRRRLRRLKLQLRREEWLAFGLLLSTFAILILGVSSAANALDFGLLWPTTFLGLASGWGLAATSISGRRAIIGGILLGPALVMIQVGNLLPPMVEVVRFFPEFLRQAALSGARLEATSLFGAWVELTTAVGALTTRLYDWFLALSRGRPLFDPVATAVIWLLVLWGAALWAAWSQRRRNQPMRALLPGLILLAAMLAVSGGSVLYLAPAFALMLILKATTSHTALERRWEAGGLEFSGRSGRKVVWTASGVAFTLMLVVLITPSPSIYRLLDMARDLSQQRDQEFARSLGLEVQPPAPQIDAFVQERFGGMPTSHLIGSGPELSEQPIMTITFGQPGALVKRLRYWRGVTYDRYTGRGWETGGSTTVTYEAGETAGRKMENQRLVRQEVSPRTDLDGLLYTSGIIVTVDETFQVAWRARYRSAEIYTDFFAAAAADGKTDAYRADSFIPIFSEDELRTAGSEVPDWIAEKYLILPDNVSDQVRALARDLTATEPSPYDRALAIERYLRRFPYALDLPAPPADREIAEYFLFDLQRGYCDYYATTMVVLARAAGLPARLVTGFVGGAYDEQNNRYTVTADLAHSWPEIYFPTYGWIPFEPTSGRPAIERPAAAEPQADPESEPELEPITAARRRAKWNLALRISASVLFMGVMASFGWWLLDLWRLRYLAPDKAITQLFGRLNRSGRRLGVRPELGETPHEFADRLSARLVALSSAGAGSTSLASAPEAIDWLTGLYARCLFSPYEPQAIQRGQAIRTWSRLRIQLVWATLLLWVNKRFRR